MTTEHCDRTAPLPLEGVVTLDPQPDPPWRRVVDASEHQPHHSARVQGSIYRRRYADMARRGRGSDAQWLAGALVAAHGDDARAVLRRWVARSGARKTWGAADAHLDAMGIPERVQLDAFAPVEARQAESPAFAWFLTD